MCNAFLCDVYHMELRGARKQLSRLRKLKRWGKRIETIDFEIEIALQSVQIARTKIDDLHVQLEKLGG